MTRKSKLTLQEKIYEAKFKVVEAYEEYVTQLYFETMPDYDPVYKYCYATSNMKIPAQFQNIDYWIRAVIKHMGLRRTGHGGEKTNALLISIPKVPNQKSKDNYMDYVTRKLNKKVKINSA